MSSSSAHRPASADTGFARLPIGKKLLLNAAVPVLLFMGFAVWLQHELGDVQTHVNVNVRADAEFAIKAKDLQINVIQVQQFLSDVSATRAQDGLDDGFKEAKAHRDEFLAEVHAFKTYLSRQAATGKIQALDQVSQNFETYYTVGVQMAQAYVREGPSGGNTLMPQFDKASEALQTSLHAFVDGEVGNMDSRLAEVHDRATQLRSMSVGLCALMGVMVSLSNWGIFRGLAQPLRLAADAAQRIATGDLRPQHLPKHDRDEIGRLMGALSNMRQGLGQLVSSVRAGITEVDTTSHTIMAANGDLSARTERQASALEETAASMQQLSMTVQQTADNAGTANQHAQHAASVAAAGGQLVREVVSTMQDIQTASTQVANIVGVINGIAVQTNLLALNAAVEAARAGEHGRGFAVVADEVRQLASRSSAAADEIKQLIQGSMVQVSRGSGLADRTGTTMEEVVSAIDKVSALVNEISHASREQSKGLAQVVEAVSHMDEVTQQNAALVEQNASTADQLRDQAQGLVQAVQVFTMHDGV